MKKNRTVSELWHLVWLTATNNRKVVNMEGVIGILDLKGAIEYQEALWLADMYERASGNWRYEEEINERTNEGFIKFVDLYYKNNVESNTFKRTWKKLHTFIKTGIFQSY